MSRRSDRPRRGRQAEAERNDRRVLDAARRVFASEGAGAPVAEIARRAGVGMGSLYRRYGSKTELLQRLCTLAMEQAIEAAEAALAAGDAWTGLAEYVHRCVAFGSGALAPLAGAIESTPEMWRTSRLGREMVETIVERARHEGGVRPDVTALDVLWLIEHFSRRRPADPTPEEENIEGRLLAIVLDGLRAGAAGPLPGEPPSARHYEGRWAIVNSDASTGSPHLG